MLLFAALHAAPRLLDLQVSSRCALIRASTNALRPRRRPRFTMATSAASSAGSSSTTPKTSVLMVCLGNICRSPAAEAVLRGLAAAGNVSDSVLVDSCGTGGGSENWYEEGGFAYHEGGPSDARMRAAASKRGLTITSTSRPLVAADFANFDYIVGMDSSNIEAIENARAHWRVPASTARVVLLSDFSSDSEFRGRAVPDPYWSGAQGFELALDLIQEACQGLLAALLAERAQVAKASGTSAP